MKARVLIIEDMSEMSELIALYLKNEGMETKILDNAEEALSLFDSETFDLIILDINLPGMDGLEFLHRFRKTMKIPVLIVSARSADEDIITGLGYGADEFVTKPFSPRVLVARVRAMLRRSQETSPPGLGNTVRFGPFTFDKEACLLKKNDQRVPLSAKEFGVLSYLLDQDGKLSTPEEIYGSVWNNKFGDLTAVAVYIQRLRRKIEEDPSNPRYLETVFGMGYRLNRENTKVDAGQP